MGGAAVWVVLLLCLLQAQGKAGAPQRNINSTDVCRKKGEAEGSIQGPAGLDWKLWTELRELRDMAIEHQVELNYSRSRTETLERENDGRVQGTAAAHHLFFL